MFVLVFSCVLAACGSSETNGQPGGDIAGGAGRAGSGGSSGSGDAGSSGAGGIAGVAGSMIPPATGAYGAYAVWVGETDSDTFPVTANAAQPARVAGSGADGNDGTVTLMMQAPDGTHTVAFATYFGGSKTDAVLASAVDAGGNVYVAGRTESLDFPLLNPLQAAHGATTPSTPTDCFIAKFDKSGKLLFSTYLGGSDNEDPIALAVDLSGLYVLGRTASADFPTTAGVAQPTFGGSSDGFSTFNLGGDIFVSKLKLDGSGLLWSTFVGGSLLDEGSALEVDSTGAVYVAGYTESPNFPTTQGAYQSTIHGPLSTSDGLFTNYDAVLFKLEPDASALEFSTLLGGSDMDYASALKLQPDGSVLLGGGFSSTDFPLLTPGSPTDRPSFLAHFSADGTSIAKMLKLGSSGDTRVGQILIVDQLAYVAGMTNAAGLAQSGAAQATLAGDYDGYVAQISSDLARAERLTYIGGSGTDSLAGAGVDDAGRVHLLLTTSSSNLPLKGDGQPSGGSLDYYWVALEPDLTSIDFATYFGGPESDNGLQATFEGLLK